MKFCSKCGAEIAEEAVVCPKCGCQVDNKNNTQKNGMAIAGFICSFFIPLLGWIFSGIGLSKSSQLDGKGKNLSVAGIIISCVSFIINLVLLV